MIWLIGQETSSLKALGFEPYGGTCVPAQMRESMRTTRLVPSAGFDYFPAVAPHRCAALAQATDEFERFESRDAARDDQQDSLAVQHGYYSITTGG